MRAALALVALALGGCSAPGHEFKQGGPQLDWYMADLYNREARGEVRLNGWYKSRDAIYVASPKACLVKGSDTQVLFHAATDPRRANSDRYQTGIDSVWNGIVTGDNDPWFSRMMTRSAHGKRIYAEVLRRGWLDTPDYSTMYGADLVRLGVPYCK